MPSLLAVFALARDSGEQPGRGGHSRLRALARSCKNRLGRLLFERGLDDTGGRDDLQTFGLDHPERREYQPSGWAFLARALRRVEVDSDDVFLDIGSGKGRVVLQAAKRPFRRVIGVELVEELNATARRNIERSRRQLVCRDVELVTADAAKYRIPDDATVIYLYSPFSGDHFRQLLRNILASLDSRARRLTLIYVNPVMAKEIEATGRFERTDVIKPLRPDPDLTSTVYVYSTKTPH